MRPGCTAVLFINMVIRIQAMRNIAVCGGGASGIFSSIFAVKTAENRVVVFEAGSKTLTKVAISGGGRCNVLHDTSKPIPELLDGYPRGKKELNGLLNKGFPPKVAQEWFQAQGVTLKTESDGRMFPVTDDSSTIIQALLGAAQEAGVHIKTRCKVQSIEQLTDGSFQIQFADKEKSTGTQLETFDAVIMATGSAPAGYELAASLGHTIVPTAPSLFTLSTKHEIKEGGLFHDLAGLSVPTARLSFQLQNGKGKKAKYMQQEGPLLITHHGLSGPAALRLSAHGARVFQDANYRGELLIHWAPHIGITDDVFDQLWTLPQATPKKTISTVCPFNLPDDSKPAIPRRLWANMVQSVGLEDKIWAEAPKKLVRKLAMQITECRVEMTGKGTFKEEFVTAGGVNLKEVDMKSMQSRKMDGLFFCGELLDVDGITGGYNFMNCWASGYTAGSNAGRFVRQSKGARETPKMIIIFGRPGSGKTTISNETLNMLYSSDILGLDLDVCVPQWMKDNFAKGVYPTLEQRHTFALDCCAFIERQMEESNPSICLISFSFVNNDLRETFRRRFPEATWCLVDTPEAEAERRIALRQGHFYAGKKSREIVNEGLSGQKGHDNVDWDFASVNFEHIVLDGGIPVNDNAKRIVDLTRTLR